MHERYDTRGPTALCTYPWIDGYTVKVLHQHLKAGQILDLSCNRKMNVISGQSGFPNNEHKDQTEPIFLQVLNRTNSSSAGKRQTCGLSSSTDVTTHTHAKVSNECPLSELGRLSHSGVAFATAAKDQYHTSPLHYEFS